MGENSRAPIPGGVRSPEHSPLPVNGKPSVILNVLFSWLVNAGYLAGIPLSLSRKRSQAKPRITRYLDEDLWIEVKLSSEFSLLYLCLLRTSKVVCNTTGNFFCVRGKDGEERWWLKILGKGDKLRLLPATSELMVELAPPPPNLGRHPALCRR